MCLLKLVGVFVLGQQSSFEFVDFFVMSWVNKSREIDTESCQHSNYTFGAYGNFTYSRRVGVWLKLQPGKEFGCKAMVREANLLHK